MSETASSSAPALAPLAPKTMRVRITPEFQTAWRTFELGHNVLVLGSAGTGKSTFLKWVNKKCQRNIAILAPTGMAALQVGGQTIHSFFGFKPQLLNGADGWRTPRQPKIFKNLDVLVIDEISMVRADVFEAMDQFLRKYGPHKGVPFGGVQILAMGDLFQLSPIVGRGEREAFHNLFPSPFFFGSKAWREGAFHVVEFSHIFRQSEAHFIQLLTHIRHGKKNPEVLAELNKRVRQKPPAGAVVLAARNQTVEEINARELASLSSAAKTYAAKTTGKVDEGAFTSPKNLQLKPGARVMFTRNDPNGRWVNGTLGEVVSCGKKEVVVLADDGKTWQVEKVKWEVVNYAFNAEKEETVPEVVGTFSQFPLTLAWALTIHKAQGQTLENCMVDLGAGGAFAEGQLYVALSRVRGLKSLTLAQPIAPKDVRTAPDVQKFYAALMHK